MKVAIVGSAPGYERAPYADESWEIWGLNDMYRLWPIGQMPRFTHWFELHGDTALTRARRPEGHFAVIAALGIPVYYFHGDPPAPNAINLDVDLLVRQGRDYFANTNSYQIALALSLGATEIALYGTPLIANREVVVERPCVAYWLGLAEGRGVEVTVHHNEEVGLLAHPYRYAYYDVADRLSSFAASERLFWSLAQWIPAETSRLRSLGRDPNDMAVEELQRDGFTVEVVGAR